MALVLGMFWKKTCQYATIDEKMCKNLKYLSIKLVGRFTKVYNLAQKI
jgi:hypothetical protein